MRPAGGKAAILLVNLGTPDEPTPAALRRYLAEFLSDPRVVEIPRLPWWLILHGIILRLRPAKSAAKYRAIWRPEGSPLLYWSGRLAARLQGHLGERGLALPVRLAMRYGQPAIGAELDRLMDEGAERILVLPLYPQYAAATTASAFDAVAHWARARRRLPELRFVADYHDDPDYIAALARHIRNYWQREGQGDVLVMSFHGLPERSRRLGDPYFDQCQATAQRLADALGLDPSRHRVTFQSRFGRARWLQPYTVPTLEQLARNSRGPIDIVCPGFATDCLETLEEIDQEARAAFRAAGGRELRYIACLNDSDGAVAALGAVAARGLAGWPVPTT